MTESNSPGSNSWTTNGDFNGREDDHLSSLNYHNAARHISPQKPDYQELDLSLPLETDTENLFSNGLEPEHQHQESPPHRRWGLSLQRKAIASAIALSTLPVLAVGATTYYFGNQSITEQVKQPHSPNKKEITRQALQIKKQLMTLAIGMGATALLTAVIAVLLVNRLISSVLSNAEVAAKAAKRLRREIGSPRTIEGDELTALETDIKLMVDKLPELLRQPKIAAERMQQLTEFTFRIRSAPNLQESLKIAVKEAHRALKADRVLFYRFKPDGSGIMIAESVNPCFPQALGSHIMDPCFKERHFEQYLNGRVQAINNIYQANLTDCHIELLGRFAVKANLVAPVIMENQLLGLLIAHQCSGPRTWQQSEINFFSLLATQVGFALDQVSLPADRKAEAEAEQLFTEITLRIRESLKLEDVLTRTVTEVRKGLKTERVIFYRLNPDGSGMVEAESVDSGLPRMIGCHILDPCFKERHIEMYRNGRVRAIDNIYKANLTDCYIELMGRYSVRASLIAPVIKDNQLLGLLITHQCSEPRAWQKSEIHLFSRLATQVGFAIDQASLLEEIKRTRQELEVALGPRDRAIAAANFGICIADAREPDYPIIYCNPAFERITGYSQKDILGRNCRFLQGPDTDPAAVSEIRMALRDLRECRVIIKNYRQDGSSFWNELAISPVRDEKGRVTHFVGLQNDISDLRQIVSQVQTAATAITQTTQENKAVLETLSTDASVEVEDIATALDAIGAIANSIEVVAKSANQAQLQMQQAHQTVQAGDEAMQQTALWMSAIQQMLIEMAQTVKGLGDFSQNITEVVNPLNDFASQTSVLAMNMALEVGRAGEEEKSRELMIVAEAVRSLAQKSATITAEIEQLITQIQGATDEVFTAMNTETEQLVTGTQLVEETQQQLSQILAMNAQTSALVEEIAQAAATQAQTSDNLNQTLREVASIADRTSTQSVLMADSFAQLLEVAQALQTSAAQFESD